MLVEPRPLVHDELHRLVEQLVAVVVVGAAAAAGAPSAPWTPST